MARVVVTGCAGFIGSHLTDYLVDAGYEVYGIDNLSTGFMENVNDKCNFIKMDLCSRQETLRVIQTIKPKYVFHLAALARIQPSIKDPLKWNDHNLTATLNLLWACKKAKVKKVVFSSSSSIYGDNKIPFKESQLPDPKSPYALSKYVCERWCRLFYDMYNLDISILRYFNVYGKRQIIKGDYATVIGIFINQVKHSKPLTVVGDGKQKRDFTFIDDVVRANVLASLHEGFGIYNIGTGKNYRIIDIANMISNNVKFVPERINEVDATKASNKKAKKELRWMPLYDLEEGIRLSV